MKSRYCFKLAEFNGFDNAGAFEHFFAQVSRVSHGCAQMELGTKPYFCMDLAEFNKNAAFIIFLLNRQIWAADRQTWAADQIFLPISKSGLPIGRSELPIGRSGLLIWAADRQHLGSVR